MTKETIKEIFGSSPNMTGKRPRMTEEKIILSFPGLTGESIKETSGLLKIRRYCSEIAELFQIRPIF